MSSASARATSATTSRRQAAKERTYRRVFEAAVALFVEQGYDATSIDQIADAADISRATFFNYFSTKLDVVQAWVDARRAQVGAGLDAASTGDTPARLRQGLLDVAALSDRDAVTSQAMVRAWLRCGGPLLPGANETAELLQTIIEEGQSAGDIDAQLDAGAASQALLDLYLGALYRWASEQDGQATLTARVSRAIDLFLTGVRSPTRTP